MLESIHYLLPSPPGSCLQPVPAAPSPQASLPAVPHAAPAPGSAMETTQISSPAACVDIYTFLYDLKPAFQTLPFLLFRSTLSAAEVFHAKAPLSRDFFNLPGFPLIFLHNSFELIPVGFVK